MSKELERLKSIIIFDKVLINMYDYMNFVSKSKKYDKKIDYQKWIKEYKN